MGIGFLFVVIICAEETASRRGRVSEMGAKGRSGGKSIEYFAGLCRRQECADVTMRTG